MVVTYRLLVVLKERFTVHPKAPFPCAEIILIHDNFALKTVRRLFKFIFAACLYPVDDEMAERLHFFSIHALSLWFDCCSLPSTKLLRDDAFIDLLNTFSTGGIGIISSLLKHHFTTLLPIYLSRSIQQNGALFFRAICDFFRVPSPRVISGSERVIAQWKPVTFQDLSKSFIDAVNVIYEECGNLVAACIVYMTLTDKQLRESAFLLLASVVPLIMLFHSGRMTDNISSILRTFVELAVLPLTSQVVHDLSEALTEPLSFCMEQIIDRISDAVANLSHELAERVLFVTIPLIVSFSLDLDSRVVSSQTEPMFMRFSCCSLIERLVTMLRPISHDADDSWVMVVWPSFVIRSGFEFVLLALVGIATSSPELHESVQLIVLALYRTDPTTVLDCLGKHLSFMFWLNNVLRSTVVTGSVVSDMLANDDSDESTTIPINLFVLSIIASIAEENVTAVVRDLPVIFSSCILNHELLRPMLLRILKAIEVAMGPDTPAMVHDLIRIEYKSVAEQAVRLYQILFQLNPKLSDAFGLEILRWGACCGDIIKATHALQAFAGFLFPANPAVVGLFARCLWILSEGLALVTAKDPSYDYSNYVSYYAAVNAVLLRIAQLQFDEKVLETDSGIFWIAIELLRCNKRAQAPIFESALEILLFHLEIPELFSQVQKPSAQFCSAKFTSRVFWKFHLPWRESFPGISDYIGFYEGDNISLCIRVINLIVQSGFPQLLNAKGNWMYTSLLTLLPWIWKIVVTDMSRFIFTSEEVGLLDGTINTLRMKIPVPELQDELAALIQDTDCDLPASMDRICSMALEYVNDDDLRPITKFYTSMLRTGDRFIRVPLYVLATCIVQNRRSTAAMFGDFAVLVQREANREDGKGRRQQLQATFLDAMGDLPSSAVLPDRRFPVLKMLERIVVVNVPHLYDFEILAETSGLCEDLNSFVPMCPLDPLFFRVDRIRLIRETLEKVDLSPYHEWSDLMVKGMTFLYDEAQMVKQTVNLEALFDVSLFVSVPTAGVDFEAVSEQDELRRASVEGSVVNQTENELVVVGPEAFLPTMEMVNEIGHELFDRC
jgi:hypothetical protein